MTGTMDNRTVAGFGDQWRRFDQRQRPEQELRAQFSAYFRIFPWDRLPPAARGLDLGCGSGRWARFVAEKTETVGKLYCLDASVTSVGVARGNLGSATPCAFCAGVAGALPLADESLDFGYCLGVIHYVPDPLSALRDAVRLLRPGAPFLVYAYYALDDRPAWFRALFRLTDLARRLISRLPYPLRYVVSQKIALLVYWPLARLAGWLERRGWKVEGIPLSAYRHKSLYAMRTDSLDRFGSRIEKRFRAAELSELMLAAGLGQVVVSPEPPYWHALGFKPSRETPADG